MQEGTFLPGMQHVLKKRPTRSGRAEAKQKIMKRVLFFLVLLLQFFSPPAAVRAASAVERPLLRVLYMANSRGAILPCPS